MTSLSVLFPVAVMWTCVGWILLSMYGFPILWLSGKEIPHNHLRLASRALGLAGCWLGPLALAVHVVFTSIECRQLKSVPPQTYYFDAFGELVVAAPGTLYERCYYLNWILMDSMAVSLALGLLVAWILVRKRHVSKNAFWFAAGARVISLLVMLAAMPTVFAYYQ